ncbi:MAG TPA: DUF3090 domain-containing protein [Cryptosporangiaceae bacterium]|nr:DUF3090 domain-containing protein [Cryptosporangiaceae bacterium]
MPGQVFAFERPERFVAGTVGEPGDRTFYLQASGSGRTVSVALEKVQVALLAERLAELLDEAHRQLGAEVGDEIPPEAVDTEPLQAPVEEEFRVGTLALAWDSDDATVLIEATAVPPEDTEGEEPPEDDLDVLRVRITPTETRAFVARAERIVAAGRPPCPLCGLPLDADGHICPRHNGYRR